MARSIQFESRRLEGAACCMYEDDRSVLEFFDQPCHLCITWSRGGRNISTLYVPDFFVLRLADKAPEQGLLLTFEEWHPHEDLRKRHQKDPERYELREDGTWMDLAAIDAARALGLDFAIHTDDDVSSNLVRNFKLLYDYRFDPHEVSPRLRDAALRAVQQRPGVTLDVLVTEVPALTIDDAHALIAERALWTDLRADLVAEPARLRLFESQEVASLIEVAPARPVQRGEVLIEVGQWLTWKRARYRIVAADHVSLDLVSNEGIAVTVRRTEIERLVSSGDISGAGSAPPSRAQFLVNLSAKARRRFEQNLKDVGPYLEGRQALPDRRIRALLRKYRLAESLLGDGVLGLAPAFGNCGRRGRRVDEATLRIAHEVINQSVLTLEQRSLRACYRLFKLRCKDRDLRPFSWRTFEMEVKAIPHEQFVQRRKGHRAAFAVGPRSDAGPMLPKDGDRALERVHFDHTELDLQLVDAETGRPLGRPWLSLAVDAYSSRVLGHVLLFDPPSATSDLLLVRDMIRRFHRFPHALVTDHGADFMSTFLQTLAVAFMVTIEYRPTGAAKFGGPVERLIGLVTSDVVHWLRGNTQISKAPRLGTGEVDPQRRAIWTIARIDEVLEHYLYEIYDNRPDASFGQSPKERFEGSLQETGVRPSRLVAYDRGFVIATCPTTRKGTARVSSQGVKIEGLRYWCPEFGHPSVLRTDVEVRFDPLNRGVAFAKVQGEWRDCHSKYFGLLNGRSGREIQLISRELRQRLRKRDVSELEIAHYLDTVVARTEEELLSSRRAAEQRELVERRGLRVIQGSPTNGAGTEELFAAVARDELVQLEDLSGS
jgi:transposase InsO family protein